MTTPYETDRGRSLIARWRILASRRLDHLIDLYESGRWRLYHEEAEFLQMVQEERAVLETWEALAPPDPSKDKVAEIAVAQIADDALGVGLSPNGISPERDLRKS